MAGAQFISSPLYKALATVSTSTPGVVGRLLDAEHADPTLKGEYGETYLHLLVGNFDASQVPAVIHLIYVLVDTGVDVNAVDIAGNTPMHVATINKLHPNILNAFIKAGADLLIQNKDGKTVLSLCKGNKRRKVVVEWFHPGLAQNVLDGDVDKVGQCIKGWCNLGVDMGTGGKGTASRANEGEGEGAEAIRQLIIENRNTNMLIHSVISGDVESVLAILEKGKVDVNVRDSTFINDREGTALVECPLIAYAIYIRMWNTVKALLKKCPEVDVNVSMRAAGDTQMPLFYYVLVYFGPIPGDVYRYIVKKARLELVEDQKFELLLKCLEMGHGPEVLHEFVTKGLTPFIRDDKGIWLRERIMETSLHMGSAEIRQRVFWVDAVVVEMAADGATEQLRELVMSGYDYSDVITPRGVSIVEIAATSKHKDTAAFLKEAATFVPQRRQLHRAIRRGNLQDVRTLTSREQLLSRDRMGWTPLIMAVIFDRKFIVKHLLKECRDSVNLTDSVGRTALHYACALKGYAELEKLLVAAGADPKVKDAKGKTASEYRASMFSNFIQNQRAVETGENQFVLDGYLRMLHAIDMGNIDRVQQARRFLIDYSLGQVEQLMQNTYPENMGTCSLLWAALDTGHEAIGLYLVSEGADITQTMVKNGTTKTLEEEAKRQGFSGLQEIIYEKLEQTAK